MKILGLDPSLSNWGYAVGLLDTGLTIIDTGVIQTKPDKTKRRQNLKDYDRCHHIYHHLVSLVKDIDVICVELPTGSQSSRACVSYGACVALTATLPVKVIVTTPNQTKRLVGSSTASKDDVINWVKDKHPYLDLSIKTKAEHIADAICAIYTGMNL